MIAMRLAAISRGVDARLVATLILTVVAAIGAASVAFQMRSPADQQVPGVTLDSTVLLGVVLPVAVLAQTVRDPSAWLAATSPRSLFAQRAAWIAALYVAAIGVAAGIAWPLAQAQLPSVVFWATLVLFDTAVISAILLGANLAWLLPGATALACSTPGLIPLKYNWLVSASKIAELAGTAIVLGLIAATAYVVLDEYGVRRRTRLVERQSGVLSD